MLFSHKSLVLFEKNFSFLPQNARFCAEIHFIKIFHHTCGERTLSVEKILQQLFPGKCLASRESCIILLRKGGGCLKFDFLVRKIKNKRVRLFGRVLIIPAKVQLTLISVGVVLVLLTGFLINKKSTVEVTSPNLQATYTVPSKTGTLSVTPTQATVPTATPHKNKYIQIHISGAVCSPGVVNIEENARLADVIEAAGGLKDNCDLSFINLASFVSDGTKIHIPFKGETPFYLPPEQTPVRTNTGNLSEHEEILKEKINLNTATISQLTKLNGIGESTAKKIIAYREVNGDFKKIEDILLVSGIGEAKFNLIKDFISV